MAHKELKNAVTRGDAMKLELALQENGDPNTTMAFSHNSSEFAEWSGHYKSVPLLIVASIKGYTRIVRLLLDYEAHTDYRGDFNATPLLAAVAYRHSQIVDILLEKEANPNESIAIGDNFNRISSATSPAIQPVKNPSMKQASVKHRKPAIKISEISDETISSSMDKELGLVGVKPDRKDTIESSDDEQDFVEANSSMLSKNNVTFVVNQLTIMNSNGNEHLQRMASNSGIQIPDAISKAGLDTRGNFRYTPLALAIVNGDEDIVKSLLKYNVDVNIRDPITGAYPIHEASILGYFEIAQMLREKDSRLDRTDYYGATPLHWSAYKGYTHLSEWLTQEGVSVSAVDKQGLTPIDWAESNNKIDLAAWLPSCKFKARTNKIKRGISASSSGTASMSHDQSPAPSQRVASASSGGTASMSHGQSPAPPAPSQETDKNVLLMNAVEKGNIGTIMQLSKSAGDLDLEYVIIAHKTAQEKRNTSVIGLLGNLEKKIKELKGWAPAFSGGPSTMSQDRYPAPYQRGTAASPGGIAPMSQGLHRALSQMNLGASTEENGISAKAIYDYDATNDEEISIRAGDLITEIEVIGNGWCQGFCNDDYGVFPLSYVNLPSHENKQGDKNDDLLKAVEEGDNKTISSLVKSVDGLHRDMVTVAKDMAQGKGNKTAVRLLNFALTKIKE